MELIIQRMCHEMLEKVTESVLENGLEVEKLVPIVALIAREASVQLIEQLITATDKAILQDKASRRKEGWVVERRGDSRTIMTQIGALKYHRTYYRNSKTNEYRYLVDEIVGVFPYERVSTGLSKELVRSSRHTSYHLASMNSCDGQVSKQTVMNKIRRAKPVIEVPTEKRSVPELHIDADEDHVALQDKAHNGRVIVPLVSVYEGVEERGRRSHCKNIFHISSYKQDTDALWEDALTRIEQRYDLTDTKIYLHGDGAPWIAKGMEWLPHATFVLDMYHKNKYIKQMLAGYTGDKLSQIRRDVEQALRDLDEAYFDNIEKLLVAHSPEREGKIREAAVYLRSHMADIAIRDIDPAARNGGATEPHVSHVLSERLSSRPKGWSEKTLQFFTPILANGPEVDIERNEPGTITPVAVNAIRETRQVYRRHRSTALWQASFQPTQAGKRTELYKALQGVIHNCRY